MIVLEQNVEAVKEGEQMRNEWALVKRRDMEAVAVEVTSFGKGSGRNRHETGSLFGRRWEVVHLESYEGHFTVCLAGQPSDELDEGEDSSIVGVNRPVRGHGEFRSLRTRTNVDGK